MTEKLRQSLSAAMDDEADAFELRRVLDELGRDGELRSLWDRYHLIGSALRGERIEIPEGLRERIWRVLDDAPAVAEAAVPAVDPDLDIDADPVVAVEDAPSHVGRYTALAVAASVAFGVVLAFNGMWGTEDRSGVELAGSDSVSAPVIVAPSPAASVAADVPAANDHLGSQVSASDVQRAQAYILHHTQQQALNQAGVMSFVKLATYEAP